MDQNKLFVLKIDASNEAIRAVLMQRGRLISFESKKLDHAQRIYLAYEKELLTFIHALEKWRHYLYCATFVVRIDHKSLKWLLS